VNADSDADRTDLLLLGQGDDLALNRIITRWERPLFAFAWRYVRNSADAQDLVAVVFVRLYERRAGLRADSRLAGWLFTALANLCHNHHRWRRRHPAVSLEAAGGPGAGLASAELAPDTGLERGEAVAAVAGAIAGLPHDMKVAVLLHYFDDLSFSEIGAILGCSERGVETRLYRARQQLRQALGSSGSDRPAL